VTRNGPRRRARGRGISTVLDVALFLLLVSAAVGLVYAAPRVDDPGSDAVADPDVAAETATTLATSTTTVWYEPAAGEAPARPARGTVAAHLARATVANATVDDRPFGGAPAYETAVRNATRTALSRVRAGTAIQVRTHWEPLPGAGLGGGFVVGPSPPPGADVHAATVAVPVGSARATGIDAPAWTEASGGWPGNVTADRGGDAAGRRDGEDGPGAGDAGGGDDAGADAGTGAGAAVDDGAAPRDGPDAPVASFAGESVAAPSTLSLVEVAERRDCVGVATAVARRVVGAAFPPERTQAALRAGSTPPGEAGLRERTVARYRTAAEAAGAEPADVPIDASARATNAALVRDLASELESAACGFDSATGAARAAEPDAVTVVVRTWSR